MDTFARPSSALSSATISVVAHTVIIAGWIYATLPPSGMPIDGVANRQYPAYVPPPDHVAGQSGSRESVHYIDVAQQGFGSGDGPRTMGNMRPATADETPASAPVDSVASPAVAPVAGKEDSVFTVLDVDTAVVRSSNSAAPAYPLKLLTAHVMGFVTARYVVDTTGFADTGSFTVITATNPEFEAAVRDALPYMRFKPAKIGPQKVRQLVEQMFSFRIDDGAASAAAPPKKPPETTAVRPR